MRIMREIKYRGKNKEIGWVYGQLAYDINGNAYIIQEVELDASYGIEETMLFATMWYRVDKETVGQYTGLKDKNLKEIYEGDIIKYTLQNHKTNEIYYEKFVVEWKEETASYVIKNNIKGVLCIDYVSRSGEVIGNIYDNPELLEKEE